MKHKFIPLLLALVLGMSMGLAGCGDNGGTQGGGTQSGGTQGGGTQGGGTQGGGTQGGGAQGGGTQGGGTQGGGTQTDLNATRPLVLATNLPNGEFNPFFVSSDVDREIVGQTMIDMLSADENGNIVAGADEPCVALDYSVIRHGTRADMPGGEDDAAYANYYTEYYFAIKDDIAFSDGEPLTINDALFNIYMYLDPAYAGSSALSSVNIRGLKAYRTQQTDSSRQEIFEQVVDAGVRERIDALREWATGRDLTYNDLTETQKSDLDKVDDLFKEEIASDWNTAMSADLKEYEKYVDRDGNKIFTENWQVFLYNYGVITLTTEKDFSDPTGVHMWYTVQRNYDTNIAKTQEALTQYVFNTMLGGKSSASDTYKSNLISVITYYATANTFRRYLRGQVLREQLNGEMPVRTVSGITMERGSTIPGENGETKQLGKEYDILKIVINGEDPTALLEFAVPVAPLHYYSSHASEFNLTAGREYFGVEFGDSEFMDEVRAIQVPCGAGPYRASTEKGTKAQDVKSIDKSKFFSDNIVYFESNENFFLGAPKIKKLRYKVVSSDLYYDAVKNGEVDFSSPMAVNYLIMRLDGSDSGKLDYTITDNLGYGYIGINATYVNELPIREAIMHAMDTNLCVDYFGSEALASPVYRPMSKTIDWCYPSDIKEPYYEFDATGQTSLWIALLAGYAPDSNGYLVKNGRRLKFTFTVVSDSEDYPAYAMMQRAADILNSVGFDITVTRDSTALSKLATGSLEVWAAERVTSADPDMYQVYHKDSSSSSVRAWGFPWIEGNSQDNTEKALLNELAERIEEGRATSDRAVRKDIYVGMSGTKLNAGGGVEDLCALDLVMELAVELPTYQRSAIYIYPRGLFDDATLALFEESTAYLSPLARIWEIGYSE